MRSIPIVPAARTSDALDAPAEDSVPTLVDLPGRWQRRARFVVFADGFRSGLTFLTVWREWQVDPSRCERLVFIAIEPHPPTRGDLDGAPHAAVDPMLARALRDAWPPMVHTLHSLEFEAGRVQLLLAFGLPRDWLPEVVAQVDAFILSMPLEAAQDARFCKAIARLAVEGATLTARHGGAALAGNLRSAGFVADAAATGAVTATYAPMFTPRRAPSRRQGPARADPHALIVGAGLAGCAAAWALAAQGWRSTVLERHADVATQASGNLAGLFHGTFNAVDGVHARFNRAAALQVQPSIRSALDQGVPGALEGLLRLEETLDIAGMQALLARLHMPSDYVRALSREEASERAGIDVSTPAWFYPGGGWIAPGGLARSYLARGGSQIDLRCGVDVDRLVRGPEGWRLLDSRGDCIAEAPTVVLANAFDAMRLLGSPGWPVGPIRGQVSLTREMGMPMPRVPIAGSGYLLPALEGWAMFGATAQSHDSDASVRRADHALNLAQLTRLLGRSPDLAVDRLDGRTAWRCSAVDRLPVIGAVPDPSAPGGRVDQARFVPRQPGLHVYTGLGSRGITWSALGAQVLASWVTGAPMPLESSLLDAIDPARFVVAGRLARRRIRASVA